MQELKACTKGTLLSGWLFVLFAFGMILLQIIVAYLVLLLLPAITCIKPDFANDITKGGIAAYGQFGDLFGVTNALFSGLAFAGVLYTVLLQRSEIRRSQETLDAQLQSERKFTLKRLSLDLYDEWHDNEMHNSRVSIEEFIDCLKVDGKIITIDSFQGDIRIDLFRVLHFFEKWALLRSVNEIDNYLMDHLLGRYLDSWSKELLSPLLINLDNDAVHASLLSLISDELLVPSGYTQMSQNAQQK